MKIDKRKNNGGARENSGAPLKYKEPLKMTSFRVPESKIKDFRIKANKILKEYLHL